jgi:acetyltransferase-like isoleucine patch superfamily enzyme
MQMRRLRVASIFPLCLPETMNPVRVVRSALRFLRQAGVVLIRYNESDLAQRLRQRLGKTQCFLDVGVYIAAPRNFRGGLGSALYRHTCVLNQKGRLELGDHSHLGAFCTVNVCQGSVTIGEGSAIGPGTQIIAYSNYYAPGKSIADVRIVRDIVIGNNVFIGANCTILPGSIVEDNVVIGAGAVVRGRLTANAIYVGVPARRQASLSSTEPSESARQ